MNYFTEINGLTIQVSYTQKNIEEIFFPLLQHLTELQEKKSGRILVMLAAPPGAGKSTLSEFLSSLSRKTPGIHPLTTIGMDGFHHRQDYLLTHTTVRHGNRIPLVKIKGAPITFDLEKLMSAIKQISSGIDCGWPQYSRPLHNPVEDAIQVTGDIILLEGNYLLLDQEGWRDLHKYADYSVRIIADPTMLRDRLIKRHIDSGKSRSDAESFVDYSDMPNVRLCLEHSLPADLNLQILADGSYLEL